MTKRIGGLGSLPKGLEWIAENSQITSVEQEVPTSSKNTESLATVELSKDEQIPSKTISTKQKSQSVAPQSSKSRIKSPAANLSEGFTRATFIIRHEHVERLKALSYVQKTSIKNLVDQAMRQFLKSRDVNTILLQALNNTTSDK